MKKVIWIVVVLVIVVIGLFAIAPLVVKTSVNSTKEKANEAISLGARREVAVLVEIYFSDHKTVPLKLEDLAQINPSTKEAYLDPTTPGVNTLTYSFVDKNNADVCVNFEPKTSEKCQHVTTR